MGKAGRLDAGEWEQVRLHPYQTERLFSRSPLLARLAGLASQHHERLDGSGYFRGAHAERQTPAGRILAAADVYHAMTEARPHRPALASNVATRELDREVRAGRLDREAVDAVMSADRQKRTAAGHATRPPPGVRSARKIGESPHAPAARGRDDRITRTR
jgi:HD-GYP domain-containing protein (c-di-GMP phosphodiesterase class II)